MQGAVIRVGRRRSLDAREKPLDVILQSSPGALFNLLDVAALDVLPPPAAGEVGRHAGDEQRPYAVSVFVRLSVLDEEEDVLRMENACLVSHRNTTNVEMGRARITDDQAIGVVIDADLAGKPAQGIFKLDEPHRFHVTQRHVNDHRQHFLLKESGVKFEREKHRRHEPAALQLVLKMFGEHFVWHVSHGTAPRGSQTRYEANQGNRDNATDR